MKKRALVAAFLALHLFGAGVQPDAAARRRSPRVRTMDRAFDEAGELGPGGDRAVGGGGRLGGGRLGDGGHLGGGGRGRGKAGRRLSAQERDEPGEGSPAGGEAGNERAKPKARAKKISPEELGRLLGRFAHEPTVEAAQEAALRLVLAEAHRPRRWLRQAPRAAWLPKVQLGAGLQQRRDRRLEEEVGSPNLFRADATNQITYEIKLSWELHRLIFEPNTLRVVHEAQRLAELREQVVMQVTRLYFERRRLQIEVLARPVTTAAAALGREMRLAELTALLNALTGGLFRSGRGAGAARR